MKYIFWVTDYWTGERYMTDEERVWATLVARKKNPKKSMMRLLGGAKVKTPYALFEAEVIKN